MAHIEVTVIRPLSAGNMYFAYPLTTPREQIVKDAIAGCTRRSRPGMRLVFTYKAKEDEQISPGVYVKSCVPPLIPVAEKGATLPAALTPTDLPAWIANGECEYTPPESELL